MSLMNYHWYREECLQVLDRDGWFFWRGSRQYQLAFDIRISWPSRVPLVWWVSTCSCVGLCRGIRKWDRVVFDRLRHLSDYLKVDLRDDIFMLYFSKKWNLSYWCAWETLILHIKYDLLHGYDFPRLGINASIDIAICSFAWMIIEIPMISRFV